MPPVAVAVVMLFASSAFSMAEEGATVIASLHDVNLAVRYADRCLLLYGDGTWDIGSCADVLDEERLTELYATPMEAVDWRATRLFIPSADVAAQ